MSDVQTCGRCARPIRSGESTRFIRTPDGSKPRIEHFTCPAPSPDRDGPSPTTPAEETGR